MKTWVLIDGNHAAWRAFHSTGDLSFKDVGTGVAYGVLRDVELLAEKFRSNDLVFCFDHWPLLRKEIYPGYKASRDRKDQTPEKQQQIDEVRRQAVQLRDELLPRLGFANVLHAEGYEADDLIAACVRDRDEDRAVMVSGDKDLWQLLRKGCSFYNPITEAVMTRKRLVASLGVTPAQWVIVKALAGCAGDDVKGIKGVGEKTAIKYLRGEMNPKTATFRMIVNNFAETVAHNHKLVALPMNGTPRFRPKQDNVTKKAWREVCLEMGMKALARRPPGMAK